jgi:ATP-dependent DNA helicase PIF1
MARLSAEQRRAFDVCVEAEPGLHMITGGGGCGKTKLLIALVAELRARGTNVAVAAPTNAAASIIGGCTVHNFLGGIKPGESVDKFIKRVYEGEAKWKDFARRTLAAVQVVFVDEISMVGRELFECIVAVLERIPHAAGPMGGRAVILAGDWYQIPPVKDVFAFKSPLIAARARPFVSAHRLEENHRARGDPRFAALLATFRAKGSLGEEEKKLLATRMIPDAPDDPAVCVIFSTNQRVNAHNAAQFARLPDAPTVFKGDGMMLTKKSNGLPLTDGTKAAFASMRVPGELALKRNAWVMMLATGQADGKSVSRGMRGKVLDFVHTRTRAATAKRGRFDALGDVAPLVHFDGMAEAVTVLPHTFQLFDQGGRPTAELTQVPLALAFAVTAHGVQGATLSRVHVVLERMFERSMSYVALSRARTLAGLTLSGSLEQGNFVIDPDAVAFNEKIFGTTAAPPAPPAHK